MPPRADHRALAANLRAGALWTNDGFTRLPGGEPVHGARYVQLSSGTTSRPRAVVLSADAIDRFLEAYARRFACSSSDVIVNWVPLYHDFGLFQGVLLPEFLGCKRVLLGTQSVVRRPAALLRAFHEHRATVSSIFNSGFALIARAAPTEIEGIDLSSLRVLSCGGEFIREPAARTFLERFAPHGLSPDVLHPGYGLAESVMACAARPAGPLKVDWVEARSLDHAALPCKPSLRGATPIVSCGPPLDGVEIAIVSEDGRSLGERETGEIVVRGPTLMQRYLHDPVATGAVLRDGWLRTGDTGYLLDGELYPCDRIKDLIITGGRNVAPGLLEAIAIDALGEHSRRAAAFGVPEPALGTESAVVVCGVRPDLDPEIWREAEATIRRRAGREAGVALADVRAVAPGWIEMTTSGKVARSRTRAKYLAEFPPAAQAPASGLLDLARRELGMAAIDAETDLIAAGADSLALLRLIIAVESGRGASIDASAWMAAPTVAALEALLAGSAPAATPPAEATASARPKPKPKLSERLASLARRGPIVRGHALLPYWLGRPFLARCAASGWIRRRLFAKELGLFRDALPTMDERALDRAIHAHAWRNWRTRVLEKPEVFSRWSVVEGRDRLDAAMASGRGVILAQAHSAAQWLGVRLTTGPVAVIGNAAFEDGRVKHVWSGTRDLVAQLASARRVLGQGGAVWMGPDLAVGDGGIATRFLGRWKVFRPGFAELALETGAPVLPVFSGVRPDGVVWFEFLPPLAVPDAALPHARRVERLLRDYAAILEQRWIADPATADVDVLRDFTSRPVCG